MKTFIFQFDYMWNDIHDREPLKDMGHQCVVVVAKSLEIAIAIAYTDKKIKNLTKKDLVATLENNECWVKDRKK